MKEVHNAPNNLSNIKCTYKVSKDIIKPSNVYLYIFAYKVNQTHYFTTERYNFKILINRLLQNCLLFHTRQCFIRVVIHCFIVQLFILWLFRRQVLVELGASKTCSQYFQLRKCSSFSLKKFTGMLWANRL